MIIDIITSFVTQIAFTLGSIILFGFLIGLCNKLFYRNMGIFGKACCYITGFLGTPVHELSHALMCLIFGHRITEIKLFQINSDDGTLGYVNHSYNPKNFYHKIGNFFIGIAPITVISLLLYLLSLVLVPNMFELMFSRTASGTFSISGIFDSLGFALEVFFSYSRSITWWLFIIISTCLALHMTLSLADIKGALSGLSLTLCVFLIIDVALAIIDSGLLLSFTSFCVRIGSYFFSVMLMAFSFSVVAVLLSFAFKLMLRKKLG